MAIVEQPAAVSQTYAERVALVRAKLEGPVERYLAQPGEEARACFHKIFDSFGESPLLGLSALGGLVAIFAYAKALWELDSYGVDAAALISAGDVGDFSVRLSVP